MSKCSAGGASWCKDKGGGCCEGVNLHRDLLFGQSTRILTLKQTCNFIFSQPDLEEILDTLGVLGIEVSRNSFSFRSVPGSVLEELECVDIPEGAFLDDAINVTEETEDAEEAFEGMAVGKVFHTVESPVGPRQEENGQNIKKSQSKIMDVKVQIQKLKIGERLLVNAEERLFQCDQCLTKFTMKKNLKVHIEAVHNKERKYQCDQCLKKFNRKRTLNVHIEAVHNKEKTNHCNQCLKNFSRNYALSVHIQSVHNKEKPYECDQCLNKFGSKIGLSLHVKTVHNKERKFQCDQCQKMFSRMYCLRMHIKTVHSIEK